MLLFCFQFVFSDHLQRLYEDRLTTRRIKLSQSILEFSFLYNKAVQDSFRLKFFSSLNIAFQQAIWSSHEVYKIPFKIHVLSLTCIYWSYALWLSIRLIFFLYFTLSYLSFKTLTYGYWFSAHKNNWLAHWPLNGWILSLYCQHYRKENSFVLQSQDSFESAKWMIEHFIYYAASEKLIGNCENSLRYLSGNKIGKF